MLFRSGYLSNSSGKIAPTPNKDDDNWIVIAKIDEATKFGSKEKCGIKNTTNCKIQDDGDNAIARPGSDYKGPGLDTKSFVKTIESIQALNELKKACEKEAPLGFILCPIFEGVVSSISSLIGGQGVTGERDGLLISFLTFSPLDLEGKDPGEDSNVLQQIVGNVVSIANAFYVIIFLLLIFASSLPIGEIGRAHV